MERRHYNWGAFIASCILSILRRVYLLFPSLILLIVGIWRTNCLYVGIVLLLIDMAWAISENLRFRKTMQTTNDPNLSDMAEALSKKNWAEEVVKIVDSKIQKDD